MKIIPMHLAELKRDIAAGLLKPRECWNRSGQTLHTLREEYRAAGHGPDQFNWDVLWASQAGTGHLYRHYNDNHIATALRAIVAQLCEEETEKSK
jgi:hypothetical protein